MVGISMDLGTTLLSVRFPLPILLRITALTDLLSRLGQVWWVNETRATAEHLAYVNDAGRAVLRVDNTTNLPPDMPNRDTVRQFPD